MVGKELVTPTSTAVICAPAPDKAAEDALRLTMSGSHLLNGVLQLINLPDGGQRELLKARFRTLSDSLKHNKTEIAKAITAALAGYRGAIKDNEDPREVIARYVGEMGLPPAVPTWAVILACNAVRMGTAPDISTAFPPSTMALRKLADTYVWPTRAELLSIRQVLNGKRWIPEQTPEHRAVVLDGFEGLRAELHGSLAADKGERRTKRQWQIDLIAQIGQEAFDAIPDADLRRMTKAHDLGWEADKVYKQAMETMVGGPATEIDPPTGD